MAVLVSIYLIAFLQVREISFWPPKIGERKKDNSKKNEKNQNTDEDIAFNEHNLQQITRKINHLVALTENIQQMIILIE